MIDLVYDIFGTVSLFVGLLRFEFFDEKVSRTLKIWKCYSLKVLVPSWAMARSDKNRKHKCKPCNKTISKNNLAKHVKTEKHKRNSKEFTHVSLKKDDDWTPYTPYTGAQLPEAIPAPPLLKELNLEFLCFGLLLILGHSNSGKTSFALTLASQMALATACISLEQPVTFLLRGYQRVFKTELQYAEIGGPTHEFCQSYYLFLEEQIIANKVKIIILDSLSGLKEPEKVTKKLNYLACKLNVYLIATKCQGLTDFHRDPCYKQANLVVHMDNRKASLVKSRYTGCLPGSSSSVKFQGSSSSVDFQSPSSSHALSPGPSSSANIPSSSRSTKR